MAEMVLIKVEYETEGTKEGYVVDESSSIDARGK